MKTTARFDARAVRRRVAGARRSGLKSGFVRFTPTGRLTIAGCTGKRGHEVCSTEKRVRTTGSHVFEGNVWLVCRSRNLAGNGAKAPPACHLRSISACLASHGPWGELVFPPMAPRRRPRSRRQRNTTPSQFVRGCTKLSPTSGRGSGRIVPPRPRHPPRSRLPQGQRRSAHDGMAAHPAPRLARRFSTKHGYTGWTG